MASHSKTLLSRRAVTTVVGLSSGLLLLRPTLLFAAATADLEPQPYFAGVNRALATLARLGSPVATADAEQLVMLSKQNDQLAVAAAEHILSRYTLLEVAVGVDGAESISVGGAPLQLVEQGWRMFLVRMTNPRGWVGDVGIAATGTGGLREVFAGMTPGHMSFDSAPVSTWAQRAHLFDTDNKAPVIESLWLMSRLEDGGALSGVGIEYRVVQLFSRDRGRRRADFRLAPWSNIHRELDFDCLPSRDVALGILDDDGRSCMASVIIKDLLDRVYPPQAMRIAPDMAFHPQVYRSDGETVRLPDGAYRIESTRGPEYLRGIESVVLGNGRDRIDIRLVRWIDPARWGWYSGDTHIHAAGCSHYASPTEGVSPETMIRHVRGEGLAIGNVLSWGPGWYYQKQFFKGRAESPAASLENPPLQMANNTSLKPRASSKDGESMLRYDVEVSGFPSSHLGHLVLLLLKEQDFPGTQKIEEWPSWNLPILQWVRSQGGVAGYAHSGYGLTVDSRELPNYEIPPMDSVGAQEAVVDVTHGLVDFLAGCNTEPVAELNLWYHLLNCGYRLALVGETDYPCITDERPGTGRCYVRLDQRPVDDGGYESWIRGLQKGRLYSGDGRSHMLDFRVRGRRSGDADVELDAPGTVRVEATVAARLEALITPELDALRRSRDPYSATWHLEKARIGDTREVTVELIVNGEAVDQRRLLADGVPRSIQFTTTILRSSWVALRILPSVHTHPVFVQVDRKPVRASQRSAQWCRDCVDKLWQTKSPFIRTAERPAALAAFDHARAVFEAIIAECDVA